MAEEPAPDSPPSASPPTSGPGNEGFDWERLRTNAQEFLRDKEAIAGLNSVIGQLESSFLKFHKQRDRRDMAIEQGRAKAVKWITIGVGLVFLAAIIGSAFLVYQGRLGSDAFAFLLGTLTGTLAAFAADRVLPYLAPQDNGPEEDG